MNLTLNFDIVTALMVLIRVVTVMAVAPVFGPVNYPAQVRIAVGLFLTVIILPMVPVPPPIQWGMMELILRSAGELMLGVSLGFGVIVLLSAVTISGQLMAMSGGMAMAQVFDPMNSDQVTMITRVKNILMFMMFIQLDLHHVLIKGMVVSFDAIPPGLVGLGAKAGILFNQLFSQIVASALQLALPAVVMVLLIQAGMAILARMAPNMNVFFSVGHTITMLVTLGVVLLSLPLYKTIFQQLFTRIDPLMRSIITLFAS